ncbi:GATA transcription factor 25 [Tripterygium wilfordii]|uniref:GATA transcription factor 25 n=1 Tax=Tripterygium wilfordii TaxID=458696 RepID=A0A7J7DKJ5_TRIWF|nr:GATA transcription factor 25-like isoform X1 [Tripterygium wilfordii]XP_038704064.1 GATA transcription factor 25-like isoform X1 [Tripterygium wilfordii]KAF5746764.1 GATA transcription factor 25 [Tripterygium wilfordii]
MYGHSQSPPMSIHRQISADEDDGSGAPDSIENHHIRYDTHPLDGSTDGDVPLEGVTPESVYVSDGGAGSELAIHRNDDTSQLTLSFRGQVYVFDAVTAEKVQAVLLLLGGCELSSGPHGADGTSQNQRAAIDFPARCSQPQRAASLNRFRQKRKERCFDKKVRYGVRQEVALRMQRNKGQFTSSKKSDGASSWGSAQDSGQDDNPQETFCTHCGISSKSTPMMRRGPSGPRSLCNACGLFWANRGTLRDISKKAQDHSSTPIVQGGGVGNDSTSETAIHTHNNLVTFPGGETSALMAEH